MYSYFFNCSIKTGNKSSTISFLLVNHIFVLVKNIKNTNYFYGIVLTFLQIVVYLPLSFIGIFAILSTIAYFSGTKPVYLIK